MPANTDIYVTEFTKLIEFKILNPDGILQMVTNDPDMKLVNLLSGLAKKEGEPKMIDDLSFFILVAIAVVIALIVIGIFFAFFHKNEKRKD